jgi:DNA-binding NarL/FixJ family response regulator
LVINLLFDVAGQAGGETSVLEIKRRAGVAAESPSWAGNLRLSVATGKAPASASESPLRSPHTTIVAMTAQALEGDRQRCLDVGMDDYISKPIDDDTIREAIEKWVAVGPSREIKTSSDSPPVSRAPPHR